MGRKKLPREARRINVCITISPIAYDRLDEMADSHDLNQSKFIEMLINDCYNRTQTSAVVKPELTTEEILKAER